MVNFALVCAIGAEVCIITAIAMMDIPTIAKVLLYVFLAMITIVTGTGIVLNRR